MGNRIDKRDRRPNVKPVERIELSETRLRLRLALAVIALLVAITALGYAVISFLNTDPGWQTITANNTDAPTCAGEFVFRYDLGRSGVTAGMESRKLTALYTEAMSDACRLFNERETFTGFCNPAYLSAHPGEDFPVDAALYHALTLLETSGSRAPYLAPLYDDYRNLFASADDAEAASFDPLTNPEAADDLRELAVWANDPAQISLTLLPDNRVRLDVSDAYLAYAAEQGITRFLDLFWLRNAFICDYVADRLSAEGYTHGTLTSFDGFTRNLDDSGTQYAFNLFAEENDKVYQAASMVYTGARAIVQLRDFALTELDTLHYYRGGDGVMRTPYIDPADGLCKAATGSLVGYAANAGCAQIALALLPVYAADTLQPDALMALSGSGIHSIWFEGSTLHATDPALMLDDVYETPTMTFDHVIHN